VDERDDGRSGFSVLRSRRASRKGAELRHFGCSCSYGSIASAARLCGKARLRRADEASRLFPTSVPARGPPLPPGEQPLSRAPKLIPNHPNHDREPESLRRYRLKTAASSVSVEVIATPVRDISEMESAVAAHAVTPSGGLLALPDSFMDVHRAEITSLAARYRLPAVYPFRQFSDVGGLLSYGNDQVDNYRRVAVYVDRILRGAKPSELPIQAPVKFELVINLRTANALGLTVPPSLLQRADEVIE
jgi:hypothetical protein